MLYFELVFWEDGLLIGVGSVLVGCLCDVCFWFYCVYVVGGGDVCVCVDCGGDV